MAEDKTTTVSSERLADLAGVNAAKVRKDLSYLGSYGTRGVGYDVEYLLYQISRQLGLTQDRPVVIVGVGNLGHALANYRGLPRPRLPRSWPSSTPTRPRSASGSATCRSASMDDLVEVLGGQTVAIGVITTPAAGRPGGGRPPGRRGRGARSSTSRRRVHRGARRTCRSGRWTCRSSCRS